MRVLITFTFCIIVSIGFGQFPQLVVEDNNSMMDYQSVTQTGLSYDHFSQIRLHQDYSDSYFGDIGTASINFIRRSQYNDVPTLEFAFGNAQGINRNFAFRVSGASKMVLTGSNGYVGLGIDTPLSKLHVTDGDVYIDDIGSGVIMKSSNGSCWRIQPDNSGNLISTSIGCPN